MLRPHPHEQQSSRATTRSVLLPASGVGDRPPPARHPLRLALPMRPPEVAVAALLLVAAAAVAAAAAAAAAESAAPLPAALRLQRAVPHKGVPLEELRRRDAARHRVSRRRLLGGVAGVVDFPVEGSANPYMVGWVSCRLRFPLCCLVVV